MRETQKGVYSRCTPIKVVFVYCYLYNLLSAVLFLAKKDVTLVAMGRDTSEVLERMR